MKLLCVFLISVSLWGQQALSLASASTSVRPGQTATVTVNYAAATPTAAGLQWTLPIPASLSLSGVAIGSAGTKAVKTLACNLLSPPASICVVYGMNANVLPAGDVAQYSLAVGAAATPGTLKLSLTGVLGATAAGTAVTLTLGADLLLTILRKEDLDGDGVVNISDVNLTVDQVVGKTACGAGDINRDARCDLLDIMLVIVAALGG